jgi:hypothetical protein
LSKKIPAATIETLAIALKKLFSSNEIIIIGGVIQRKMYRSFTLCKEEEMSGRFG